MTSPYSILLTGGTGKVASCIAPLLQQAGHATLIASRKGTAPLGFTGVKLDWLDDSTYEGPFQVSPNIISIFLVAPTTPDPFPHMKAFIDFAITKGVRRFVLLSASVYEAGGPAMGKVHQYLIDLKVEFAALRPSWFMENFSQPNDLRFDVGKGEVYSATGKGRIPWVSAEDIGAVAYHALTDKISHDTEHIILGPELLTYQDCAQVLSEVLNRKISNVNLTLEEMVSRFIAIGLNKSYAEFLASLDEDIEQGVEDRLNDVVLKVTGQAPKTFREFVEVNKATWTL